MKQIVDKLAELEKQIAQEKAPFVLFALFLREDAPGVWDLLVSAPWITQNQQESLKWLAEKLKEVLETDELLKLSRIVIIAPDNPALDAMQRAVHVDHGVVEVRDSNFFGLQIRHAYIMTSRRAEESSQSGSGQRSG